MDNRNAQRLFKQAEVGDLTAAAELEGLARSGDAEAQFLTARLADLQERGNLSVDLQRARSWYESAAMQGHALAQLSIGNMYDYGDGGEQNFEKARRWYESAAKQGVRDAQLHYARMVHTGRGGSKSDAEAAHWYRKAVELGDVHAATNLALMHLNDEVEDSSSSEAMRLFLMAASAMDGLAHLMLGRMFLDGRGVAPHDKQALLFFCIAALLLPPGNNRQIAVSAKEEVLKKYPRLRKQFENDARQYVDQRTGQIPFVRD